MMDMDSNMDTPGREFYKRQVAFLEAKDVTGLVTTQYAPEAQIVSFDFVVQGQQDLLDHFVSYLENLGELQLISTNQFVETEDTVFFEATFQVRGGVARAYNAFVLKDGKATHHFTNRLGFTPD